MKKIIWFVFSLCFLFGCSDSATPFVDVSSTNDPVDSSYLLPDGAFVSELDASSDSDVTPIVERIPAAHNAYVCYCRFQLPLNCIGPGCGLAIGTSVTRDGYCDSGIREANICIPQTTPSLPVEAIIADCANRATSTLREALRAMYPYCRTNEVPNLGPCDIRYGCEARRLDGTVRTFHAERCETDCRDVPLERQADGSWNLQQATYIPAEVQHYCNATNEPTNHICAWY